MLAHAGLFRFGASSLANDIVLQLESNAPAATRRGDYFTKD